MSYTLVYSFDEPGPAPLLALGTSQPFSVITAAHSKEEAAGSVGACALFLTSQLPEQVPS
jgi:hypothetical protein